MSLDLVPSGLPCCRPGKMSILGLLAVISAGGVGSPSFLDHQFVLLEVSAVIGIDSCNRTIEKNKMDVCVWDC